MKRYEVYTQVTLELISEVEAESETEAIKAITSECLAGHGHVVDVIGKATEVDLYGTPSRDR